MNAVEYCCVFVRAAGDRLHAAERLVLTFPQLFGTAYSEVDLYYRSASRFLGIVVRFDPVAFLPGLRERLAFWTARAGGRVTPLTGLGKEEDEKIRSHLELCELSRKAIAPASLFDASARFFSDAGAQAGRRRNHAERPVLAMDVGGPGWEGVRWAPDRKELFIAAPIAPPAGDQVMLAIRMPGADRPAPATAKVVEVRPPNAASPGLAAGYTLRIEAAAPQVAHVLAQHAPPPSSSEPLRAAPRFTVNTPVRVIADPPDAGVPEAVDAAAVAPTPAAPPPIQKLGSSDELPCAVDASDSAPAPVSDGPPAPAPGEATAPATQPAAVPAAAPGPQATIEYATDQELAADFLLNLSQGGAFVRTASPQAVGTSVTLELKLPNGSDLRARAVVAFVNANGMGLRFQLDPEAESVLSAAIAHISARPRRALVVDDDGLLREMLTDALSERGFEVLTAADAQAGMRTLSEELLGLDLLVTDIRMPGMNGEELIRLIRKTGGETELAIVAITGNLEDGLEPKLEAAGADAVLDKALGVGLIAQAADAVLERKRLVAPG